MFVLISYSGWRGGGGVVHLFLFTQDIWQQEKFLFPENRHAPYIHDTRQMELELVKWNVQTKLYSRGLFLVDFLAGLDDFVSILSFIVWLNVYFARFQWNKQKFISYVKRLIPFYSKHFATSPLFGWWTFTAYTAHIHTRHYYFYYVS